MVGNGRQNGKNELSFGQMIKMVIFCVIAFALTWLPFNALIVIGDLNPVIWEHQSIMYIWFITHYLAMCHTITNPLIYIWMNNHFRTGFREAIADLCIFMQRKLCFLMYNFVCCGFWLSCSREKYLNFERDIARKRTRRGPLISSGSINVTTNNQSNKSYKSSNNTQNSNSNITSNSLLHKQNHQAGHTEQPGRESQRNGGHAVGRLSPGGSVADNNHTLATSTTQSGCTTSLLMHTGASARLSDLSMDESPQVSPIANGGAAVTQERERRPSGGTVVGVMAGRKCVIVRPEQWVGADAGDLRATRPRPEEGPPAESRGGRGAARGCCAGAVCGKCGPKCIRHTTRRFRSGSRGKLEGRSSGLGAPIEVAGGRKGAGQTGEGRAARGPESRGRRCRRGRPREQSAPAIRLQMRGPQIAEQRDTLDSVRAPHPQSPKARAPVGGGPSKRPKVEGRPSSGPSAGGESLEGRHSDSGPLSCCELRAGHRGVDAQPASRQRWPQEELSKRAGLSAAPPPPASRADRPPKLGPNGRAGSLQSETNATDTAKSSHEARSKSESHQQPPAACGAPARDTGCGRAGGSACGAGASSAGGRSMGALPVPATNRIMLELASAAGPKALGEARAELPQSRRDGALLEGGSCVRPRQQLGQLEGEPCGVSRPLDNRQTHQRPHESAQQWQGWPPGELDTRGAGGRPGDAQQATRGQRGRENVANCFHTREPLEEAHGDGENADDSGGSHTLPADLQPVCVQKTRPPLCMLPGVEDALGCPLDWRLLAPELSGADWA